MTTEGDGPGLGRTATRRLILGIAVGALVAGSVDIFVAAAINAASPVVILKAIASGLLGHAAFAGGTGVAILGLALQWGMSLIIAGVYGLASLRLPDLYRRPWIFGALYGVGVYIVMTFVVVPLSAANPHHLPSMKGVIVNLAAMILYGLIVALTGRSTSAGGRASR